MLNYSSVLLRLVEHTLRLEQFYGCLFQPMYTLCICHQLCVEYCTATWRHPGLSIVNQWELSNITCMNRIDQSHAPKLVTEDEQTRDRQGKKWLIGLSAHARAKKRKLYQTSQDIGPSRVCALPLGVAAELSVHYFCNYFSFFSFRATCQGFIVGFFWKN